MLDILLLEILGGLVRGSVQPGPVSTTILGSRFRDMCIQAKCGDTHSPHAPPTDILVLIEALPELK